MPDLIAGERFDQREALERLAQTVAEASGLKLVVVDMIGDFLPLKDSNDYQEATRKFAPLRQLAEQHSIHLCVTTHTKKVQTDNPVHAVIGSQAIAGAVDQVVILNTDSRQQRTITTIQRYGESIPLTLLNWSSDKRAMFLGKNADEARAEQKKSTEERVTQDLMVYIMGNPSHTREEILDAVRGDAATKRKVFNTLKDEGYIAQSGSGQKGDPYLYTMSDESDLLAAQAA
jgi:chromosome segregation and condensation protein ScpB